MTTPLPRVPGRARMTLLALGLPLAILLAAVAWAVSLLPRLPDPVATHWGADGLPDGFGSPAQTLVMLVALVIPFTVGMWALGFFLGSASSTRRLAVFVSVWFAVAICGLIVGSLAVQQGLADAAEAPGVGTSIGISFAAGAVLGVLAVLLVPGDRPQPTSAPVPDTAERLVLRAGEQAAWVRTVEMPGLRVLVGASVALVIVSAGVMVLSDRAVGAVTAASLAAAAALIVVLGRWTVTVDHNGLSARCALPRPRTIVPLDEVESAELIEVRPLADFGGWGYRVGAGGRVGIVLRAGEAILVHRTGGRQLVVTVDDAETGAALLNTLADRSRLR